MKDILPITEVLLLGLILISLWLVLYQLMKQQGRMLLRIDNVEGRLGIAAHAAGNGAPAEPRGLRVGTVFPPFSLPDLTGKMVSLEDFKGKKVLLLHWSFQCGFCNMIAPDLVELEPELEKANVQLVLFSYGEAETSRKSAEEHGLNYPILLQEKSQTLEPFQGFGTPVAYLLDEKGEVAKPLAVGAKQVPALAGEAIGGGSDTKRKRLPGEKSLSQSRIERKGLKAGTPAPAFSLPDIHGRTVSLEEFRGKRVLLVFSDPHCGPCDQLAPHLVRIHQEHRDNSLAVILVGRGEREENRVKAEKYGFEFPVVLQDKWKLSKEYGIFATPVAFLIGEDGVIARNVGQGVEQVLNLVSKEEYTRKH